MWSCFNKFVRKYMQSFFCQLQVIQKAPYCPLVLNLKNKFKKKIQNVFGKHCKFFESTVGLFSSFYSMVLWDALLLFVLYGLLNTFCVYIVWHPFQMCITNVQTVTQNRLFPIHTAKLAQKDEKSAKQTELPAWYTQNEDERWGNAPGIRGAVDVERLRI